ncbi:hypothetical protein IT779_10455 [Nocardia sp. NEAU-351]|uniref:Mce-associated membrane protein n=1 Tax=Nocardia bovistercoris TaxID=2785916 RepID=A0A931N2A4_9NOCA|nr:hypothetical protein [Nocardia bovistercoris]
MRAVTGRSRRIASSSIQVRTLLTACMILALVAAVAVLGYQVNAKNGDLAAERSAAADAARAEQVATAYALGAAEMDFHDLAAWRGRLTAGTAPELTDRLTRAATSMEQIITPLQWISTSKPIAAKVRSRHEGIYSVDCFVSVLTKNSQAPDGIESTAAYQLTIDSRDQWAITEIGGSDVGLTPGASPR